MRSRKGEMTWRSLGVAATSSAANDDHTATVISSSSNSLIN